ncbi:MAG: PhoPQ-activated pathogenicity-related family protein [Planctomycetaceae bacterium]
MPCACFLLLSLAPAAVKADGDEQLPPDALFRYVARAEPDFDWKIIDRGDGEAGRYLEVALTSQRWHDIVWKHALLICEPETLAFPNHVLLLVSGGSTGKRPSDKDVELGMQLARLCGARVAVLYQVPNQPLLGDRKEDDLITETWLRYLDTGDDTWPLLFPMVKSAVKAMDAIEQVAEAEWKQPVKGFVMTGASKRGWTSWLTPAADRRVIATAPLVIDVLNFLPQMQHQLDSWGQYSEQINDYTSKGLVKTAEEETPRDTLLRRMMDPYGYRKRLTLPKLLVNGTNDRYWVVDAMKLYWDDLEGQKSALFIPNAGHDLEGGRELVYRTIAAFFRHACRERPLPVLKWTNTRTADAIRFTVTASAPPKAARLWTARSPEDRDFPDEHWTAEPLHAESETYRATIAPPEAGHVAYYCELEFESDGLTYSLTTLIHVEPAK